MTDDETLDCALHHPRRGPCWGGLVEFVYSQDPLSLSGILPPPLAWYNLVSDVCGSRCPDFCLLGELNCGYGQWVDVTVPRPATYLMLLAAVIGSSLLYAERSTLQSFLASFAVSDSKDVRWDSRAYGRLTGTAYAVAASLQIREVKREADRLRVELERGRSGATLSKLGVLKLMLNRPEEAIALFDEASKALPGNAELWTNLAAAHLKQGLSGGAPDLREVVFALSCADRAAEIDPQSPAAQYNKALSIERLSLLPWARAAWYRYLRLDNDSPWAGEARMRLQTLENINAERSWNQNLALLRSAIANREGAKILAVVRRFPQPSRQYVEDHVFGEWAQAWKEGRRADADSTHSEAKAVGAALIEANGDHMIADSVAAIDRAKLLAETAGALIEGHFMFQQGLNAYVQDQLEVASDWFGKAETLLRRGQSPFSYRASLYRGIALYSRSEFTAALSILRELQNPEIAIHYPDLLARTYWIEGMCQLSLGDPAASVRSYLTALGLFDSLHSDTEIASIHHLLAENFRYLGNDQEAWEHRRAALAKVPRIYDLKRLYAILDETANAALKLGAPRAALYFRRAVVKLAWEKPDPRGVSFALLRRAQTYDKLDQRQRALKDVEQAGRFCDLIKEAPSRQYQKVRISAAEVEIRFAHDPNQAALSLGKALSYYQSIGNRFPLVSLYLSRAKVYMKLVQLDLAKQDLLAAINEYEVQRTLLVAEDEKIAYFSQAREAFDSLIALDVANHAIDGALSHLEQERARVLLDRMVPASFSFLSSQRSPGEAPRLTLTHLGRQLPPKVTLIEYAVLEDRVLIWATGSAGCGFVMKPILATELLREIEQLNAVLQSQKTDPRVRLGALYDEIIRPVLSQVRNGDTLVFVPDKSLYLVSFAALFDSKRSRFLIEDHAIGIAPSAALYLRAVERERIVGQRVRTEKLLLIANPAIDRHLFPDLPNLEESEREVLKIADLYPHSEVEVLVREKATKQLFLTRANSFDVVHFAGHSIINPGYPGLSRLQMAPGGGSEGTLFSVEIETVRFDRTRLLILASCDSGAGAIDNSEGLMSLARAFFSAGVPTVIGSMWPLYDRPTASLFAEFHRNLAEGVSPETALRNAQLGELARCGGQFNCIAEWAGIEALGGVGVAPTGPKSQ
jgi:CHAT domain-containing protein